MKRRNMQGNLVLENLCRSCLSERGHLKHIFSSSISKMIEFCMSTTIHENDKLPDHICITCFRHVAKFYYFKKKFEKVDRFLRKYVKKLSELKQEGEFYFEEGDDLDIKSRFETFKKHKTCKIIEQMHFDKNSKTTDRFTKTDNKIVLPLATLKQETNDCLEIYDFEEGECNDKNHLEEQTAAPVLVPNMNNDVVKEVIFSNDPPPLVLLPSTKISNITNDAEKTVRNLPKNTPPLIPLEQPPNQSQSKPSKVIEVPLECTICTEMFTSSEKLKLHRMSSCQTNILHCNICKKQFNDRKRLIGHLKGHIVSKDYECKLCKKRYPNPSTLRIHFRSHTGERPFKCQICNKGFTRYAGVMGHMRIHSSEKPYQCSTCGRCFKVPSNLERHKKIHMRSMSYCCNYCGKTFNQLHNLELHIRSCHTHERPFLCSECGKGYVSSNRLSRHMWVHTGNKPYKCKYCTKAYTNSNDLKNHQKMHLGGFSQDDKPFACSQCNMRFFHRCRLLKHVKVHDKRFGCDDCFKVFSSGALLNRHMVKHKTTATADNRPHDDNTSYPMLMLMVE